MVEQSLAPKVSVVIPTLNGAKHLPGFFKMLNSQSFPPCEVIVGDSASEDDTVKICLENGAKVIHIERDSFDHGGTRSKLAKLAKGEFVIFFTQDALLVDHDAIKRLLELFERDHAIGCAYGRQLASKNATVFARHLRDFNYPSVSSVTKFADKQIKGLRTIFISNTFAAYKAKVLEECGYFKDDLIFGEDTYALGVILKLGYEVGYVAEACVYHSHNYTLKEEFLRSFDIGVLHGSEKWLLDTYGGAENIGASYVRSIFKLLFTEKRYFLMIDCFCRNGLKFLGYKLGRHHRYLPKSLLPHLSMNRRWWSKNR